jgi:hypothetical protein
MKKTVAVTFSVENENSNNSLVDGAFRFVKEMGGQVEVLCVHEEKVSVEDTLDTVLAKLKDVLPGFPGREPWQEGGDR